MCITGLNIEPFLILHFYFAKFELIKEFINSKFDWIKLTNQISRKKRFMEVYQ